MTASAAGASRGRSPGTASRSGASPSPTSTGRGRGARCHWRGGDPEDLALGAGQSVLPDPAAQQILDGRRVGRLQRVGVVELVGHRDTGERIGTGERIVTGGELASEAARRLPGHRRRLDGAGGVGRVLHPVVSSGVGGGAAGGLGGVRCGVEFTEGLPCGVSGGSSRGRFLSGGVPRARRRPGRRRSGRGPRRPARR